MNTILEPPSQESQKKVLNDSGTKPTFLFEPESEFERLREALRPSPVQHEVKERKPRIGLAGRILLYTFLIGAAFLIALVMFIGAVGVC